MAPHSERCDKQRHKCAPRQHGVLPNLLQEQQAQSSLALTDTLPEKLLQVKQYRAFRQSFVLLDPSRRDGFTARCLSDRFPGVAAVAMLRRR